MNAAVNRLLTFSSTGPLAARRVSLGIAVVWATSVAATSLAILGVHAGHVRDPLVLLAALVAANGLAATVRFVVLHAWMFAGAPVGAGAGTRRA